ncbi:hypothetical protein C8R45DRAFT_569363 [Mycena sanguinolenta]|nr:hypothetical protein C8R45DRAFT_569363 [Mycena sanguinolenta]
MGRIVSLLTPSAHIWLIVLSDYYPRCLPGVSAGDCQRYTNFSLTLLAGWHTFSRRHGVTSISCRSAMTGRPRYACILYNDL